MAHVPRPPGNPITPLWKVGWNVDGFARQLQSLADRIDNIYLIGYWLAGPFRGMATTMFWVSDRLFEANDYVSEIFVWVDGIIAGSTFPDLLYNLSSHFQMIRFNSSGWVLGRLASIHWELAYFAKFPTSYIKWKIGTVVYKFDLLVTNPYAWLKDVVWHNFYALYPFLVDPGEAIANLLWSHFRPLYYLWRHPAWWLWDAFATYFPDLYGLVTNPWLWLTLKLANLFPVAYQFLQDPDGWLLEKVRQMLGLPYGFWSDPIGTLLRLLLEEVERRLLRFADLIARVTLAVVIHFM